MTSLHADQTEGRDFSDPYEMQSEEQLREKADARGCDLLVGDDHMLLLDLDSEAQFAQFNRMLDQIQDTARSRVAPYDPHVLPSRNDRWHAVVKLADPLPLPERIALQAILGSDPLREFLLLAEYLLCGQAVNCLFRPRKEDPDHA